MVVFLEFLNWSLNYMIACGVARVDIVDLERAVWKNALRCQGTDHHPLYVLRCVCGCTAKSGPYALK